MTKKCLNIFAFGGNDVASVDLKDPETGKAVAADIPIQWQRTAETCWQIANIIEENPDEQYIVTHGNGPQVGSILLRAEYARPILHSLPLDVCVADTQGAMGYMIGNLNNELNLRGVDKLVATTVTQVVVKGDDPDFKDPTKYIGPGYTEEEAKVRTKENGWKLKVYKKNEDGTDMWRRVVPSPKPFDIVEIDAIESNLMAGIVPVTVGGGGVPVMEVLPKKSSDEIVYNCNYGVVHRRKADSDKPMPTIYTGVEAVIDKDLASALLGQMLIKRANDRGEEVDASLTIFTNVEGLKLNFQKKNQKDVLHITVSELKKLVKDRPQDFPAGSMGPKINAAINFIEGGGSRAYITTSDSFTETKAGRTGTTVVPG